MHRSRIDGETYAGAAEPQRVSDAASECLVRIFLVVQQVMIVDLENERYLAGVIACPGLQKSERCCISVAACFDCKLEVVTRIIGRRVRCKAAGGAMLEPLIDWKDDQLACAREPPLILKPRKIGYRPRIISAVPT